jgi:putative hydrolase of the HAD superfamily
MTDLTHIDTWLFDLDNTLYPPSSGYILAIEERIKQYFMRLTGLPADEAWAVQKRYLDEHGSAVPGLIEHHDADPHDFLREVHDVPLDVLVPDPDLRHALARLPGRRLVFTNGSEWHAERVLERLQIADLFDEVFHTEAAGLIAKPDPRAFDALILAYAVTPATTAFFEDRAVNLKPAAALGMTTVLVGEHAFDDRSTDDYVQHRTRVLADFLNAAKVRAPA